MHAKLIALAGLLTITSSANPITPTKRTQTPYFEVRNFTFSKSDTSSRYSFSIDFPQPVSVTASGEPVTVPGFKDAVPCTGTYFYSPSETSTITPINACGTIGDGEDAAVTTKLDVASGDLYLQYVYNATVDGVLQSFVYQGEQTGLSPVGSEAMEGFNTPASGPGV